MQQEPITPTTCDYCGQPFNTSEVHPRRYCSIACEEGRGPKPQHDPSSEGFHLAVQGEPEYLVGRNLIANGVKRTCYSPDWHRSPDSYNVRRILDHDEDNEILVVKSDVFLGQVTDYQDGRFKVRHEEPDGSLSHFRWYDASMVVAQLREDNWWAE